MAGYNSFPETIRPLWQSLTEKGFSSASLDGFERWLRANPGTEIVDRNDYCEILSAIPRGKTYLPLANYLLDTLYAKYQKDPQNADDIVWMSYLVFSRYAGRYDAMISRKLAGNISAPDIEAIRCDALKKGVTQTLKEGRPDEEGNVGAYMTKVCLRRMQDEMREVRILRDKDYAAAERIESTGKINPRMRDRIIKRAIAHPLSMHGEGVNRRLPFDPPVQLDLLTEGNRTADIKNRLIAISRRLPQRTQQVMDQMIACLDDDEEHPQTAVATKLSINKQAVTNHVTRIRQTIVKHDPGLLESLGLSTEPRDKGKRSR